MCVIICGDICDTDWSLSRHMGDNGETWCGMVLQTIKNSINWANLR